MTIFEQFPDREAFDRYWNENYVPVTYEDVREAFENFVSAADGHIYNSDYEENGCVSKEDFKDNLSEEAQFSFQDGLTEAFYDKNPEVYENALPCLRKRRCPAMESWMWRRRFTRFLTVCMRNF